MARKNYDRIKRVNSLIKQALSDIIKNEVKDPKIGMLSISKVDTTKDLKYAKIYISVLGDNEQRAHTIEVLNKLSRFFMHKLNEEIRIRTIPELTFILDDSMDYYFHIDELLKKAKEK